MGEMMKQGYVGVVSVLLPLLLLACARTTAAQASWADDFSWLTAPDDDSLLAAPVPSAAEFWGFDNVTEAVLGGAFDLPARYRRPVRPQDHPRLAAMFPGMPLRGVGNSSAAEAFDSRFRNPCWWREGSLQCIPAFLVIGMPKAGSTDFAMKLGKNKEIIPFGKKENHFWVYGKTLRLRYDGNPEDVGVAYEKLWKKQSRFLQTHQGARKRIFGDMSGTALWAALTTSPAPHRPSRLQALAAVHPAHSSKFILLLRHPTDRFFSEFRFYMVQHRGRASGSLSEAGESVLQQATFTPQTFHRFVLVQLGSWRDCVEANPGEVWRCIFVPGKTVTEPTVGMYAVLLRQWQAVVGSENLLPVCLGDWHRDEAGQLRRVAEFLGTTADRYDSDQPSMVNKGTSRLKMLPATKKLLDDFFEPFNVALQHILQHKCEAWANRDKRKPAADTTRPPAAAEEGAEPADEEDAGDSEDVATVAIAGTGQLTEQTDDDDYNEDDLECEECAYMAGSEWQGEHPSTQQV